MRQNPVSAPATLRPVCALSPAPRLQSKTARTLSYSESRDANSGASPFSASSASSSTRARHHAAWRDRIVSASPASISLSCAYCRVVSSIR